MSESGVVVVFFAIDAVAGSAEFGLHALVSHNFMNAWPLTSLFGQHPFDQFTKLSRVPVLRYPPVRFVQDRLAQRVLVTLVNVGCLVRAAFVDDTA